MSLPGDQMIGHRIISKVDGLIEVITAANMQSSEEQRQELVDRGCLLTGEIISLLVKIIGQNNNYLHEALKELVKQRVSGQGLLADGFFETFEEMHDQAVGKTKVETPAKQVTTTPVDDLQRALLLLFPLAKIVKNHKLYGVDLNYFIPSLKLAIIDTATEKDFEQARRDFLFRRDGIQVIRLDAQSAIGYREIARNIKRQLYK